ncbi:MAG TPA: DUF72 domain-containing protein [Thermoanaerobaculia bacterium]|nr:DUF72 domain-containing protein [Thermoanaerobaculia bacterium]
MLLRVGTSGYSYKEWKGSFYPADLPASKMLPFYGERFSTVEINNTFYRMPAPSALDGWAAQVPDGFRFALKAPQRITHQKKLAGAEDDVRFLVDTAATLGEKLGPLLFQLPPYLRCDLDRLRAFLESLPAGVTAAFEFRHDSWFDPGVTAALAGRGAALCAADSEDRPLDHIDATAPWGYLRLRRTDYDDAALGAWADRIAAAPWSEAWIFFKHEDEGKGPAYAARFVELARERGLEIAR